MAGRFVKIFGSILASSVWSEPESTRVVWLAMLVLADTEGNVWGSVPGIARLAGVSLEAAQAALDKLCAPDRFSRTPDHEGRRLLVVDGGWHVVNAQKYREMQTDGQRKTSVRMRDYRSREATGLNEAIRTQGEACACCGRSFLTPYAKHVVPDQDPETGDVRAAVCCPCARLIEALDHGNECEGDRADQARRYVAARHGRHALRGLRTDVDVDQEGEVEAERETKERLPAAPAADAPNSTGTSSEAIEPPQTPSPQSTADRHATSRPGRERTIACTPSQGAWTTRACEMWIKRYGGTAPGGRIGKALKPLVTRDGEAIVLAAFGLFLAETGDHEKAFRTPGVFAATFYGEYHRKATRAAKPERAAATPPPPTPEQRGRINQAFAGVDAATKFPTGGEAHRKANE